MTKLLLGGSPCQGFSLARGGKQLDFNDPRSMYVQTYKQVMDQYEPDYWLFENVMMREKPRDMISEIFGCEPIEIDAIETTPTKRKRLYWTNIPYTKGVTTGMGLNYIMQSNKEIPEHYFDSRNKVKLKDNAFEIMTDANDYRCKHIGDATNIKGMDNIKRVYHPLGKVPTLTAMTGGHREPFVYVSDGLYRKMTITEMERAMGMPDGYTQYGNFDNGKRIIDGVLVDHFVEDVKHISNTQRKKMIGNGWQCDVIADILSGIPDAYDGLQPELKSVVSLFDGCSCGRLALKKSGFIVRRYLASEIDPYCSAVSRYQHPDIEHHGDVRHFVNKIPNLLIERKVA